MPSVRAAEPAAASVKAIAVRRLRGSGVFVMRAVCGASHTGDDPDHRTETITAKGSGKESNKVGSGLAERTALHEDVRSATASAGVSAEAIFGGEPAVIRNAELLKSESRYNGLTNTTVVDVVVKIDFERSGS